MSIQNLPQRCDLTIIQGIASHLTELIDDERSSPTMAPSQTLSRGNPCGMDGTFYRTSQLLSRFLFCTTYGSEDCLDMPRQNYQSCRMRMSSGSVVPRGLHMDSCSTPKVKVYRGLERRAESRPKRKASSRPPLLPPIGPWGIPSRRFSCRCELTLRSRASAPEQD